jgi:hypothetical protein
MNYLAIWVEEQNWIEFYFNTLFTVLKFIDTSSLIEDDERVQYFDIVFMNMSTSERTVVFYEVLLGSTQSWYKERFDISVKYKVFDRYRIESMPNELHLPLLKLKIENPSILDQYD